jgi:2,4-dienoyl-CoA reductase-like NADH-dependent reductase (Old Yellow Enzyme family)
MFRRFVPIEGGPSMSVLFTPLRVGDRDLANRIVIAPMCQYSAVEGCMTDWHLIHLGHLALSGAALLTLEASAVLAEGRITDADVGLWNDATEAAIARTLESVRRWSDMPIAIQLAARLGFDPPIRPARRASSGVHLWALPIA